MWLAKPKIFTTMVLYTKKLLTPDFSHGKSSWVYSKHNWKALKVVKWLGLLPWRDDWSQWIQLSVSTLLGLIKRSRERQTLWGWEWAEEKGQVYLIMAPFLGGLLFCQRFFSKWMRKPVQLSSRNSQSPFCSISGKDSQEDPEPESLSLKVLRIWVGEVYLADSQLSLQHAGPALLLPAPFTIPWAFSHSFSPVFNIHHQAICFQL